MISLCLFLLLLFANKTKDGGPLVWVGMDRALVSRFGLAWCLVVGSARTRFVDKKSMEESDWRFQGRLCVIFQAEICKNKTRTLATRRYRDRVMSCEGLVLTALETSLHLPFFFSFSFSTTMPARTNPSLAAALMTANLLGPSFTPPYHLVTTTMASQISISCIR